MTHRPRTAAQAGFTLVEVMLVSSLFLVVLAATLSSFTTFERKSRDGEKVAEHVETARSTLDRAARQMRNLARRNTAELVIRSASANDLIFQTSSPEKRWMRYCLASAAPRTTLYLQETAGSSFTAAMAGGTAGTCPATSGWDVTSVAASNVTNALQTPQQDVFGYQCTTGAVAGCPRAAYLSEDSDRLKNVSMTLLVDLNTSLDPPAMRVSSSVFLRNQNEPPVPAFTWSSLGNRKVLLNGSASTDPEGRTLRFYFFKGTVPTFACSSLPPATSEYYTGVAPTYTFGATETSATFTLVVCDAGDIQRTSASQVVTP